MTDAPTEPEGEGAWTKLRHRKVVQWGIAYLAGAWALLQGIGFAADAFAWPSAIKQVALLLLLIGLPIVLVVAWYHGDRGEQRINRSEIAILTLLFLLGCGSFWLYGHRSQPTSSTTDFAQPSVAPSPSEQRPSIAVLPFENRSAKQDDAYFVDGIHDDILTQLTKIGAMKVIARTSVEQFRDTKLTTREIGEKLGVTRVLEGGVQRAGDRVRVTVQLIDATSDVHLWAESYDRELTAANIFAIQSEVAAAIADSLKATLTAGEKARVAAIPTQNLEAWEAYQLGRQRVARRTSAGLIEAETFFRRAIKLDPKFALAYVGLADSLSLRLDYVDTPVVTTLQRAQAAVDTALRLDPGLSEAWASSGLIASFRTQFDQAEQMYQRAIELNPNNAMALKWRGELLILTGRFDEGQRALEKAASLDPLSAIIQKNLAQGLEREGRFADAEAHYRRAVEIDPSMPGPYMELAGLKAFGLNRFADAVLLVRKAAELDPANPYSSTQLAFLYLDLGDDTRLLETAGLAAKLWPDNGQVQFLLAYVDLIRQDKAGAVRHAVRSLDVIPRHGGSLALLRAADLEHGGGDAVLARYRRAYPELFVQGVPHVDMLNYGVAVDLALVLQRRDEKARFSALLDAVALTIGKLPRLGRSGYGITDVQVHALRGEKREALVALREAEKAGYRGDWRYYRDFDANLAAIRDEPEFKAVFADIERDMARQRAELAKRPKDAPLDLAAVH